MWIRETVMRASVAAALAVPMAFAQDAGQPKNDAAQQAQKDDAQAQRNAAQARQEAREVRQQARQVKQEAEQLKQEIKREIKAQINEQVAQQVAQVAQIAPKEVVRQIQAQVRAQTAQLGQPAAVTITRSGSYLGIGIQEVDSDRAKALKLREEAGVEITRIEKDSPAEKAGLMTGDVVLTYNGQRVEGMEQFTRMVRETPVGRDVKLDIWRNAAPMSVTAKIATRSGRTVFGDGNFTFNFPEPFIPDVPRNLMTWRTALLGIDAEALDGQLATYFGIKEGVLVRSVVAGSAAEKAGIKAGDVITRVDGSDVRTPTDLSTRLRGLRGKSVDVVVTREHREMTLNVMIADDQGGGRGDRARAVRAVQLVAGDDPF